MKPANERTINIDKGGEEYVRMSELWRKSAF